MLVVDVVDRQHGAACEKELLRKGLEAERLQGQAQQRFGAAGCEEGESEGKSRTPMSGRRRRNVEMRDLGTIMGVDAYLCSLRTLE
ncbi:hypothetical protein RBB78_23060 [Tunturiibacter empetritectus]|uniref:hypothetical protein n=1 Tax=Tunturiibacter empetritectus TaxID=3069691 RepID=UPI003D9BBA31